MTLERREYIQRALHEMQRTPGVGPLRHLFQTELEYEPVNFTLFRDQWPESAREALAEDAQIVFAVGNADDQFYVIYCRLADEHNRMLLTKERAVITYLLQRYPYAMFVFSSRNQDQWHFVNVKYDKDDRARRLFRRISVSRFERLRTAVDRIADLSVPSMPRDLFGLTAFQVQQVHDKAFDVEKVTKDFFIAYKRIFDELQADLHQQTNDLRWAHDFALQFLNRIMFLYFVQRKLWLRTEVGPKGDPDFINTFWKMYRKHGKAADTFYSRWLAVLFFNAFNQGEKDEEDPAWAHLPSSLKKSMADAPYLNGGLFRENDLDKRKGFVITDIRFSQVFEFLERYNFTISEDTPLDQEVAVDPEMIGKVYESLVNVSEDGTTDERSEAGIFYTPRTEIDLMCRLSLVDWLSNHLGEQHKPLLYDVVFAFTEDEKQAADAELRQHNFWPQLQNLLNTMQVLDPACGSGSFLVGMLIVLDDLHQRVDHELGIVRRPYDRRRDIIGRNLYGVDVKDWAVHVAELRLWLQLVIETEITSTEAKVRPLLPNLSFKVRCGDSLVQEVGGVNLAVRHSGFMSDGAIAGRINQLRGEKLNFYTNASHGKTLQQLQQAEYEVFRDLLSARRAKIEQGLTENTAIPAQASLFDDGLDSNDTVSVAKLDREREQLQAELEQVQRAQNALKTVNDVPFVWDIAFVEVFESERRGFDIIIGNPPYVRQEEISDPVNGLTNAAYKERLARAVYSAWPQTFGYYQSAKKKQWSLNAKSDLYIYFYFHSLSLLNEHGTFCFVTSNSWLDVGYGSDLQRFLLTRGSVKLVIDNQMRRSFATADVNTVIVLFGAARDTAQNYSPSLQNLARFVMVTAPFEVVLNAQTWKAIDQLDARTTTAEYRVYPLLQHLLLKEGTNEHNEFDGDKWGGKYLRAPSVFWQLFQERASSLLTLAQVSDVRFGIKTGANEFFFMDETVVAEWGIESEFVFPVLKSPREAEGIVVDPKRLPTRLFICNKDRRALKGTRALEYINWGEQQGLASRPSTASRGNWWSIGVRRAAHINCNYQIHHTMKFFISDTPFYVSNNFHEVHVQSAPYSVCASINSSISQLWINVTGRSNFGGGLLKVEGYETKLIPLVNPRLLDEEKCKSIIRASLSLELGSQDRRELDRYICAQTGISDEFLTQIEDALQSQVEYRLKRAKSI